MRPIVLVAVLLAGAVALLSAPAIRGRAEEPKEESKNRIDLLVPLKPGESKEVLVCTRVLRGPGVGIRERGAAELPAADRSKHGITVSVVRMEKSPEPWDEKGLETYAVKIKAAKDAKPTSVDLRIVNETSAGVCETGLKVLITTP